MKKALFKYIVILFTLQASAQSNMDNVLSSIKKNNKTIQSITQYWNAQKLQYRTGIYLANPTIEYDYLKGSPAEAGNQTDFTVNQSFDFPTSYFKKKQLAEQQLLQGDLHLRATNQEILFEVQQVLIELVFRNRLQIPLNNRLQSTEKWLSSFQKRLKQGDGNVLDVNRAELRLIQIKKNYNTNLSAILRLQEKLTSLNGSEALVFNDTVYFDVPAIPDFETLEKEIEENDPLRKVLQQEKIIAEKQVEVSKA
ncbi:MAG TPA: TolC family protein, partial [Flavobacterium sp.]